ncbi:phage/plasmid replication protein [Desulfitobacterium sp. LBE]|uniref:phage/plasmid replication domain-containing protein n=1 Tax=Desulfitobacterium sp. LBE TaxID=884086 RepID=UPI0011A5E8F2|nr:phage/plasmid replication protein [Desulfitobacterium sp. LBE]
MLGHNVFGGPLDFSTSVKWLINFLNESFKNYAVWSPVLPPWDEWRVFRVDVAEVFNLGSFEAVEEWFRGVNFANFPRRTVNKYAMSGLYASGRTTTVKAYHKGVEFAKHDRKRLYRYLGLDKLNELQNFANSNFEGRGGN